MLRRTDSVVASRPPLQDSIKSRANRAKKHSRAAIFNSVRVPSAALDVSFAGSPLQNSPDDFVMTSWRWSWRGYSKSITENMCCNCGEGACAIKDREAFMSQENPLMKGIIELRSGNCRIQCFCSLIPTWQGLKYFSPDVLICTCVCACVIYIYASPTPVFNLAPRRRLISVAKALGLI